MVDTTHLEYIYTDPHHDDTFDEFIKEDFVSFQQYFWTGCWPEDRPFHVDSWRTIKIRPFDIISVIERHHFYKENVCGPVDKIHPEDFEHHKIAEISLRNGDKYLVWDQDRTAKDVLKYG